MDMILDVLAVTVVAIVAVVAFLAVRYRAPDHSIVRFAEDRACHRRC